MAKFGFIGMGNMGYAMLKGALREYGTDQIVFSAKTREKMEQVFAETGVRYAESNKACASQSKYIILAIKPQVFDQIIPEIADFVSTDSVVISLAPGITIKSLEERFGQGRRIVRAMPNTPALVGEGMTGVCYDRAVFAEEEEEDIRRLMESFGRMMIVEERLMDVLACASGSSPAYVYLFIEALADSVVKLGMPRASAYELVAQAVLGSAKMVLDTGEHPGLLKDRVCSPGGTTIAGIAALEKYGLRNSLFEATEACYGACQKLK